MNWSISKLKELEKKGTIRGWKEITPIKKETPAGKIVSKLFKKKSKEKEWIETQLFYWCQNRGLQLQEEYRFHTKRKWRFDYAIAEIKIAIEYEGIFSDHSRHTNKIGYSKDTDKYRQAALLGWTVLRYTAINHADLLTDLNRIYAIQKSHDKE